VIGCGAAGVQDPLGLRSAQPLLLPELLLVVREDPTDRFVRAAADLGTLCGCAGACPHPFELADEARQLGEQHLERCAVEVVHLDAGERPHGGGDRVEPLRELTGTRRVGGVGSLSPYVRGCHCVP
jgi:hypothetical protein